MPEIVEMRLREAYAALPERRPARPARPRLRVLRTALAAAALCVALPVTVLAATGELLPMIEGAIAFFRTDAATTLDSIQNTFEAYNAAVALEKTDAGVTFTVDNISVDDNFINLFGRMQATGLRQSCRRRTPPETATRCSTGRCRIGGLSRTTTCRGRWSVSATRYTVSITP